MLRGHLSKGTGTRQDSAPLSNMRRPSEYSRAMSPVVRLVTSKTRYSWLGLEASTKMSVRNYQKLYLRIPNIQRTMKLIFNKSAGRRVLGGQSLGGWMMLRQTLQLQAIGTERKHQKPAGIFLVAQDYRFNHNS